jgi:hypothetical protein
LGRIVDIGRRIELVPMDPHFHDIAIALYEQRREGGLDFLVHTYSGRDGAAARIASVVEAMKVLGGMESAAGAPNLVRFACNGAHHAACRRLFLEACKLAPGTAHEPRPLSIFDKKSGRTITVDGDGEGLYRVSADGGEDGRARRVAAVAGGLAKLGEMEPVGDAGDRVAFPCGHAHDAPVGLLLVRALNVRTVLRESEQQAARGVLAAPSAQQG